jgi:hypothetical protein
MNIIYKYNNDNVDFNEVRNILIKAFGGRKIDDKDKVEKAFENTTDNSTVVDIDKNKNLIFSNSLFPRIKYNYSAWLKYSKSVAKELVNSCTATIARGERMLFKHIIASEINAGKSFEELFNSAQNFTNPERQNVFLNILSTARRAKVEHPQQKLDISLIDYMDMKIAEENYRKNPPKFVSSNFAYS